MERYAQRINQPTGGNFTLTKNSIDDTSIISDNKPVPATHKTKFDLYPKVDDKDSYDPLDIKSASYQLSLQRKRNMKDQYEKRTYVKQNTLPDKNVKVKMNKINMTSVDNSKETALQTDRTEVNDKNSKDTLFLQQSIKKKNSNEMNIESIQTNVEM